MKLYAPPKYVIRENKSPAKVRQDISPEEFIRLVQELGVARAIDMRYRSTGRTIRDILTLAHKLSAGEKIILVHSAKPGSTLDYTKEVLRKVYDCCYSLGMVAVERTNNSLHFQPSNGRITILSESANQRGLGEVYALHDN